ncbi:LysR family transcriptional regulator [Thiothrix subterranea]|uniref:LysR substrate-binding domain-containing protein n=1 Tax=Thiothrix subterranea TaxID=2735563 RepID=A0AA51MLQ0_9GAMM|nr:LysR substrate-binding domain-containing protein [Thiothrix subterranea]MDQ5769295.1 LysR substrate-binding domain-containing protein [Thiothrix subterranea]WML86278.1 LysR substrate-binding domain-containing protein [Thiothrix subterranea]
MNWNLDDVPVFVAVVTQNGVSTAADYLGISKSAVSKALARLEQGLGMRLLERNTRNIRITSEGEAFYRHSLLILEQVDEANAVMAGLAAIPSGRLVVALPMAFGREIVAPHLSKFRQQYPQIALEIMITSHPVDIIRDQVDIAVVIGLLNDSELIVKKLYESKLVCVTTPAYAQRHHLGDSPEELLAHVQICEKRYASSHCPIRLHGHKKPMELGKNVIYVNDPIAVRDAVLHGCGVSLVPDQYCKTQLHSGELIRVFEQMDFDASVSVISAIYPSRRLISNKTRVFLDFLIHLCEQI